MDATAFFYPSVVSWGQNRLDYFHIGKENGAHHKYWDGNQWVSLVLPQYGAETITDESRTQQANIPSA
jgi:hypothetical protein